MDAYYASQSSNSMPYFSGHYRQRGSGFGALAAGIGRVALPIARKFIWPTAKRIGRELISQAAPEVADVVMKKKTAKQAFKNTVKKTARKQFGGSLHYRVRKSYSRPSKTKRSVRQRKSKRRVIPSKSRLQRSRVDFFSRVKHAK